MNPYILFLSLLTSACRKDTITTPLPCILYLCDTSKLEIVWQKSINFDTTEKISNPPIYFNGNVLFSRSTIEESIDTLKLFDSKMGNIKWRWTDYLTGRKPSLIFGIAPKFLQNNKFLFTTGKDLYCVDANSGKSIWRSQLESNSTNVRIGGIENYVYQVLDQGTRSIDFSFLVRYDINVGTRDTIYTQPKIDGFEPDISPPTVSWTNKTGDSILFFQIRYWNFSASKGRVDWVAFNLSTKSEEFRLNDIDIGHIGTTVGAIVSDDKIYFCCSYSAICVNKYDGKLLWQKVFDINSETILSTSPFIAEGKLFIKTDNKTLYALDLVTGAEIWVDKDSGSSCYDMVYDKGLLYYSCNGNAKIYAIEAATGKIIWAEPSPNKYPNQFNGNRKFGFSGANIGYGGVAIDSINGVLFTSDDFFTMCLKLPKR